MTLLPPGFLLIISANAITLNREIAPIDRIGNWVSGMIFRPRHVLCLVGLNKITKDVEAACRNTVGQVKQNSDRIHLLVVNQDLGF